MLADRESACHRKAHVHALCTTYNAYIIITCRLNHTQYVYVNTFYCLRYKTCCSFVCGK